MKKVSAVLAILLTVCLLFSGCAAGISDTSAASSAPASTQLVTEYGASEQNVTYEQPQNTTEPSTTTEAETTEPSTQTPPASEEEHEASLASIPVYAGTPYVVINDNVPGFSSTDYTTQSYERYSDLDRLGRCGAAMACIGWDIMPTEERGEIGQVKPTGYQTVKYDCVEGKYLYNRCHLIAYQLSGENANTKNLITGTRYMNTEGMLPFENMVADYVQETGNHVLYRVTPIFEGDNLLATGVQMEACSVEDEGDGICFNVFVFNVQPQIVINYTNGDSSYADDASNAAEGVTESTGEAAISYVLNTNTKKFHYPTCSSASRIKESNKEYYTGSREVLIERGYDPCKNCNP